MRYFPPLRWLQSTAAGLGLFSITTVSAWALDEPSAADALKLKPTQSGVDYDTPTTSVQADCKVQSISDDKLRGWTVTDPDGIVLRRFLDTNEDNKLDRWCYYKNGVEVFRDIDDNFNGVADQHRWLGTAGIRWGIDANEDGTIDSWRAISAEEVTSEIVAAIRTKDQDRFERVLMTPRELEQLGLGEEQTAELAKRISSAKQKFSEFVRGQNKITQETRWLHFGGTRPGVIPSGTDGSTRDVTVYDNVAAIVETDGTHGQVAIGSLFQVGDRWRAIELPEMLVEGQASTNGGFFSQASMTTLADSGRPALPAGVSEESQKLLGDYDNIDKQLSNATSPAEIARLNASRADLLIELAKNAEVGEERMNWVRQFADTVSGAFQTGEYPGGLKKLGDFEDYLRQTKADDDAVAYVYYRRLNAAYTQDIQAEDADLQKVQETWLENLADFVKNHRSSEHTPEAMSQLALAEEFAGADDRAIAWYERIAKEFPESPIAAKAKGAQRRLELVGKPLRIQGTTLDNKSIDTGSFRNQVVVVHYWASWCDLCKDEFSTLKDMQAKYRSRGLALVGVNLDATASMAKKELQSTPLPWPQLYEEGGLEGRLANQLGIVTLPTMLLIDKEGRVVRRNITAAELDGELRKLLQ